MRRCFDQRSALLPVPRTMVNREIVYRTYIFVETSCGRNGVDRVALCFRDLVFRL